MGQVTNLDEPILLLGVLRDIDLLRLVVERVRVRSLELLAEDGDFLAVGRAEGVLERRAGEEMGWSAM
jgi:hypothetical protein